jgi:hypothetical protein
MTMFLAVLAVVIGLVIWRVLTVTAFSDPAPLGRMSERWLAELRASSPT